MDIDKARPDLTTDGRLRVSINLGNPILVQKDETVSEETGIKGITVDLARELARRLDVPLDLVMFRSAGLVVDALEREKLNVVFLAIDPKRANEIDFTDPYVLLEGNYLVRNDAPFQTVADLDVTGRSVAVVKGSAYDLHLTAHLKHAVILRHNAHDEAVADFRNNGLSAVAGIRQPLEALAHQDAGLRLIETPFMTIRQAMGVPKGRRHGLAYLENFLEDVKRSGFTAQALKRSGQSKAAAIP